MFVVVVVVVVMEHLRQTTENRCHQWMRKHLPHVPENVGRESCGP